MLQNVSCVASASAVDALYKKSCQMLQKLPRGCDTSVPMYLRQWDLCRAHVALGFWSTTVAHRGCEQAERSAKAAHQFIVAP